MARPPVLCLLRATAMAILLAICTTVMAVDGHPPPAIRQTMTAAGVTTLQDAENLRATLLQALAAARVRPQHVTGGAVACGASASSAARCQGASPTCATPPVAGRRPCGLVITLGWTGTRGRRGRACPGACPPAARAGGARAASCIMTLPGRNPRRSACVARYGVAAIKQRRAPAH